MTIRSGKGAIRAGALRRPRVSRAKKVSVTVDERVLREVAKDARRSGRTLSAQITDALARDLRRKRLKALIERYEAEHGVITEAELEAVRQEWRESRSTAVR